MIGIFSYTVLLTYLGLITGTIGIGFCASGNAFAGAICLAVAGLFDLFDGTVARTKKARSDIEKDFGVQIDSLADMVNFGILPIMLGYAIGLDKWYFFIPMALFALSGLIRLAYFNATTEEFVDSGKKKYFLGVPITMAMVVFGTIFALSNNFMYFNSGREIFKWFYAIALVIMAVLFLVKIRIPKPGKIGMTVLFFIGATIFFLLVINCRELYDIWVNHNFDIYK